MFPAMSSRRHSIRICKSGIWVLEGRGSRRAFFLLVHAATHPAFLHPILPLDCYNSWRDHGAILHTDERLILGHRTSH